MFLFDNDSAESIIVKDGLTKRGTVVRFRSEFMLGVLSGYHGKLRRHRGWRGSSRNVYSAKAAPLLSIEITTTS